MNKRIIVAEDSSVIQNLTKKILSIQHYDVIAVKNGKEVLDEIDQHPVDMILLDINMPVMDGVACAKAIRTHKKTEIQKIPIIAITGNARNFTKEEFEAFGINDFLPKPLNYDEMVSKVNRFFGKE